VSTRHTAAWVRGVSRCAKNQNRTRTRDTRFGNTAGLPIPVFNPNKGYTQDEQSKSPSTLHHMERVNYKIRWYTPTHQSKHPKWLSSTATTRNFTQTHLFQQDDPVDEGVQGWGAKDAQFDANKYGSHHISHPLKPQRVWRKLGFFD
jgi:hypothetical protein